MEGGRRLRRLGIARGKYHHHVPNSLPLYSASSLSNFSNTISCWYCDYKIFLLNNSIFRFGRRNARYLKVWFSIGVGFCLALMLGLALVLLLEFGRILKVHNIYPELSKLLFGPSLTVSGLSISFADAAHLVFSTLLSVSVHEFGHAIAAASEDVQVEYIAVFIAVMFPGALVAFNSDVLHALPRLSALRIYSAGVWHNAVTCAICGMALLALPVILQPLYIHGQGLMVLEIPLSSPLHSYLSPGDVIVSFDGILIQDQQDWIRATSIFYKISNQETNYSLHSGNIRDINSNKGYCVPRVLAEQSEFVDDPSACLDDLTGFMSTVCSPLGIVDYRHGEGGDPEREEHSYCLNATEIVKFEKCGDGWLHAVTNGSSCTCTQDDSCLIPLQVWGSTWVEVSYITPDSPECLEIGKAFHGSRAPELVKEGNCSGTFVYVGDFSAFSDTLQLTPYRPRKAFPLGAYLPNFLEKILNCTYHVSLALALLNCLPVLYLDGESMLEVNLEYCWYLCRRRRKQILNIILFAGTSISVVSFIRVITEG